MLALEWCHLCFSSSVFLMQFPKQEVSLTNIALIHNGMVKENIETSHVYVIGQHLAMTMDNK